MSKNKVESYRRSWCGPLAWNMPTQAWTHMCIHYPQGFFSLIVNTVFTEIKRVHQIPWSCNYEPQCGAGSQTAVIYKSSRYFWPMSHLSGAPTHLQSLKSKVILNFKECYMQHYVQKRRETRVCWEWVDMLSVCGVDLSVLELLCGCARRAVERNGALRKQASQQCAVLHEKRLAGMSSTLWDSEPKPFKLLI